MNKYHFPSIIGYTMRWYLDSFKYIAFVSFFLAGLEVYAQHIHGSKLEIIWQEYNDNQLKDSAIANLGLTDADRNLYHFFLDYKLGKSGARFINKFNGINPTRKQLLEYKSSEFDKYVLLSHTFLKEKRQYEQNLSYKSVSNRLAIANQPCSNTDFETGTMANWVAERGNSSIFDCTTPPCNFIPTQPKITTKQNKDFFIPNLSTVYPGSGKYSLRIEDTISGSSTSDGHATVVRQTFQVTSTNNVFIYHFACVMLEPDSSHTDAQRPYFKARMYDQNGNQINCSSYEAKARFPLEGFKKYGKTSYYYRDWSTVSIPLTNYVGQNVTIEFIASDCAFGPCLGYAYIDADCFGLPVNQNLSMCENSYLTIKSAPGFKNYKWTGPGIVGIDTLENVRINQPGLYTLKVKTIADVPCDVTYTFNVSKMLTCNFMKYDTSICETTVGSKVNSKVNLLNYNNLVSSYLFSGGNVNGWYSAYPQSSNKINAPTNYPIKDGDMVYATIQATSTRIDTVSLTFKVKSRTATKFLNGPFCIATNSIQVLASPSGGVFWGTNINSQGLFTPSSNGNTIVSYSYLNDEGCYDTTSADISKKAPDPIKIDYCPTNGPAKLTAGDGKSYNWYKDANLTIPVNSTVLLSSGVNVSYMPSTTSSDVTVYFKSIDTLSGILGPKSFNQTDYSTTLRYGGKLTIIVQATTLIKSFTVNAGWIISGPTNYTFSLNGVNKTVLLQPNTPTIVIMNVTLSPGTYTLSASGALMYSSSMGISSMGKVTISNSKGYNAYSNLSFFTIDNLNDNCPANSAVLHNNCCTSPSIGTQPTDVTLVINGTNTATFSVSATGTGTLTYQWQADNGTGTFTDIAGATSATYTTSAVTQTMNGYKYRCVISLNGSCPVTSSSAQITTSVQPCNPPIVTNAPAVCQNAVSPDLNLHVTAASGAVLNWYTVATGGTPASAAPLISTTGVGVKDVWVSQSLNGCESTRAKISFTVNALPNVTATASKSVCTGTQVTLSGAGASTYTWDNGVVDGAAFTPTSTKTYTVTGTDANGCKATATSTVTVNALPNVTATASKSVCTGTQVTLSGAGASTYTWDNGVVDGVAFTPASTKTYTVTGTDANGCKATATSTVTVNALPNVTATASQAVCIGTQVTLSGAGTSTYTWDNGVVDGVAFIPASTKTYTVTGTDANGCKATATSTVTVNALPNVTATASQAVCIGTQVTLSGAGASTYTWDNGVVDGAAFTPTSTKTYTVTGTDANGCKATATSIVIVNAIPAAPSVVNPSDVCQYTISPDLSDAVTGTGLLWYTVATGGTGTSIVPVINTDNVGTFDVFVSQTINTCESNRTKVSLTVNAGPNKPAINNPAAVCIHESVPVLSATGTNLLWYLSETGGTGSTITPSLSSGVAGSFDYWVSQTSLGCEGPRAKVTFTVNALPVVTAGVAQAVCAGSSVILSGSGASIYVWDKGIVDGQTFVPVATSTYTVTGTDVNGCSNTATVTVSVNALPTVTAGVAQSVCAGTSVTLSGSGASTYIWDSGVIDQQAFVPAATNTYTVTGTDVNGCKNTATVTVSVNALPTVTAGAAQSVCAGTSVTLSGSGASTYVWDSGVIDQQAFVPAATNTYTVTGTDVNGCKNTATVTVSVNALPTVTAGAAQSVCAGSPVTLSGSGASTYVWDSGVIDQQAFVPIATSTYTVTGTDINGCASTATVTVTVNPSATVSLISASPTASQTVCEGIAIDQIEYSAIGVSGASITGLPAGVSGVYSNGVIIIKGTAVQSGAYHYTVTATGGCGVPSAIGSITVSPRVTLVLSSDASTAMQSLCLNNTINPVVYTTSNAGNASVTGLPAGVSFTYINNSLIITGNSTTSGIYDYTVVATGACGSVSATGKLTVTGPAAILLVSSVGTDKQTKCINTSLTEIKYSVSGATGVAATGLPAGVTGNFEAGFFTISGTPATSGSFSYSLTVTGGCTSPAAGGVIQVVNLPKVKIAEVPVSSGFKGVLLDATASTPVPGPGISYKWHPVSTGTVTPGLVPDKAVVRPEELISSYQLTISIDSLSSCSTSSTVRVEVKVLLDIPNVFSPNGDGNHDFFEILNSDLFPDATIEIYNQWGDKVYTKQGGYYGNWDGTCNGKALPVATYYYIFTPNYTGYKATAGSVSILR